MHAPAVCDRCGTVFPSGIAFSGRASARLVNNKAGPCPDCGGMGSVVDGTYEAMGDILNIVSSWSPQRIEGMLASLERAKNAPNARDATEALIRDDRDLLALMTRLMVPRDPATFWAFVAALMAILTYLRG